MAPLHARRGAPEGPGGAARGAADPRSAKLRTMALANLLVYTFASLPAPLIPNTDVNACVKMGIPLQRLKSSAVRCACYRMAGRAAAEETRAHHTTVVVMANKHASGAAKRGENNTDALWP